MKRNLVTQEELDAIARVNDDCIKLHVCPPPVTFVDMEVTNADGELVDGFTSLAHSWVRNAYNAMAYFFTKCFDASTFGEGYLTLKRESGTVINGSNAGTLIEAANSDAAISSQTQRGIVVGSSNSAFSLNSYGLTAKIAHGSSAGQLSYSEQNATVKSYDSGTKKWTFTIVRYFNNNSGASISVNEVGVFADSAYDILTCRDVLDTPVSVPNGGQLTVTYTIEMTFPG